MANTVQIIVAVKDNASSALGGITSSLGNMATVAGGIVAAGALTAIAGGLAGLVKSGFDGANAIEQATAKLNAFTKDSAVSAQILNELRLEATKTPFAFEDMANAGTSLLPIANQLNVDLMDLVRTAEILAATNPAEGLSGAAFALKEAASGDFTSVIERFNLSRVAINALKDEGVPNLEIISRALADAGYDMDLVSNLAETFDGRMSTLKDGVQNVATAFATPIFEAFSDGLGAALGGVEMSLPVWEELAKKAGEDTVAWVQQQADVWLPRLRDGWQQTKDTVQTFKEAWEGNWVDSDIILPIHRLTGNLALNLKPAWDTVVEAAGWFVERGEEVGNLISGTLVPFVGSLTSAFDAMFNSNNEVNNAMQAGNLLLLTFKKSVEGFLGNAATGILMFFEDAAFFIDMVAAKIRVATDALNTFASIVSTLGGVGPVIDAAVSSATAAVGTVGPAAPTQQQGSVPKPSTPVGDNRGQVQVGATASASTGGTMVAGAGSNIFYMTVNNDLDIQQVAYEVARIIQQERSST